MAIFSFLRSILLNRNASTPVSSLQISRSFLPPGFSCLYRTERAPTDTATLRGRMGDFIVDFCPLILDPLLATSKALDWKGGGIDDALVRVTGQLQLDDEALPFTYKISTRFSDFPNRNQIRFTWEKQCSLEELETIPLGDLCLRQDITISSFSFALENFQSNILTRLSGFGPVVGEVLKIDISTSMISLIVSAEGLASPDQAPLTRGGLFEKVNALFEKCYQFSIHSDYTSLKGELL